jgi:hypothetical protein
MEWPNRSNVDEWPTETSVEAPAMVKPTMESSV